MHPSAVQESLTAVIGTLATQLQDLAGEVHAGELLRAVRKGDVLGVQRYAALCNREAINCRCASHGGSGPFSLCAPPLWLAVYRRDQSTVSTLLENGQCDANATSEMCPGEGRARDCPIGGSSVLHVAISRGAADCVRMLLLAGADTSAPSCFAVAEADEPEYDDKTDAFGPGLCGLTALQLAALLSEDAICQDLLAHGADASSLARLPPRTSLPASLASKLVPLRSSEDGEGLDCPICFEPLLRLTSSWTPCCARPFHTHCLKGLTKCPLCRGTFAAGGVPRAAPAGDAALAVQLQQQQQQQPPQFQQQAHQPADAAAPTRRASNSLASTANHDRALDLAFSGPWFEGGASGSHPGPSIFQERYGWT